MSLVHFTSTKFKTTTERATATAPESRMVYTVLTTPEQQMVEKEKSKGSVWGEWYSPGVAYADDTVVLETSQKHWSE